ncbi:hypothetical protein LP032_050 [Listeria phage LP-032]|uniref:Uncharacterized protein n=2 Tax=Homburgvirus LP26 TaxID=1921126 RepID=A0A059TAG6_9CAUD|nr:hypothetical protein LP026_112 [Listeria phage LP-026]AHL18899.1 hypothetical protein LP032_050 [Listeria phage LP-032]AHN84806.1 hypothetical protein LP026_112 [Listeria phage LP-026]
MRLILFEDKLYELSFTIRSAKYIEAVTEKPYAEGLAHWKESELDDEGLLCWSMFINQEEFRNIPFADFQKRALEFLELKEQDYIEEWAGTLAKAYSDSFSQVVDVVPFKPLKVNQENGEDPIEKLYKNFLDVRNMVVTLAEMGIDPRCLDDLTFAEYSAIQKAKVKKDLWEAELMLYEMSPHISKKNTNKMPTAEKFVGVKITNGEQEKGETANGVIIPESNEDAKAMWEEAMAKFGNAEKEMDGES